MTNLSLRERFTYLKFFMDKKYANSPYIQEMKRMVREACKETDEEVHYSEDSEDCWVKEFVDTHFTEEEKAEIIDDMRLRYLESQYDCTGQWFTTSIKFCETKAGTWIYHFMSLDV